MLDPDGCFRALRAHDARFDGVFFVGIRTTGIYCRPICPARPARRDSCLFFDNAAAAEREGFRPCLRCRPEIAPGNARTDAVSRIAASALARIEGGALNESSVDDLALEFGVTARHLRRAVEQEYGVAPVEIAQTQRLLLAKQLLTETSLPVTEIAFASGFSSVRRFNALFQERYRLSPTRVRGRRALAELGATIQCEVSYRPPFDWLATLQFLRIRAIAGIETVDATRYSRKVVIGKHTGDVAVFPSPRKNALRVEMSANLSPVLGMVLTRVKRLFDLGAHPQMIEARLAEDPRLAPVVLANPGLRVPGAFDGFEMALRAVLGQQVSVQAARTIAGRFVTAFEGIDAGRIASATTEQVRALGLTGSRTVTVLALARAVAEGAVRLEPGVDIERTMARLKELPGIGEWTAQYIAMRALGWPDAFPHTDLGVYKALGTRSPKQVLEIAAAWSPWRAYSVIYLWKSLGSAEAK